MYGLESGKSYPAELIAELLDAAADEGKKAASNAFGEGYKQGLLDGQPDAAYWQAYFASVSKTMKEQSQGPTWGTVFAFSASGVIMGALGAFFGIMLAR